MKASTINTSKENRQYPVSVQAGIPRLKELKSDWQRARIGDLFTEISRPVDMLDDEIYTLVTVKRSRGGVAKRERLSGKDISVKSQFYVKEGDFLISKRQIVHGACAFVPKELDGAIVSNEYSVLRCSDLISPMFLKYLSHTQYFQQTCFHSSIGVHIEKMIFKLPQWFKWKIDIPLEKGQAEMSQLFHAADQKKGLLENKKELLEQYKKGIMQKLASQEIRFQDDEGKDFPEWQELRAKDIFKNHSNKKHDGTLPILAATQDQGIVHRDTLEKIIQTSDASVKSYKVVEQGDFVISLRSFQGGLEYSSVKGICSPAYTILKPKIEISEGYFKHYFKKESFISQLAASIIGIRDGKQISYDTFSAMKLPCPSKEEGDKIALFINTIDKKIADVGKKIELTQTYKQGLLQQMFI